MFTLQRLWLKEMFCRSLVPGICCLWAPCARCMRSDSFISFPFTFVLTQRLQEYEEVIIPPARPVPPRLTERLVPIAELDGLARGCFPVNLKVLKRMIYTNANGRATQSSIVYNLSFIQQHTNLMKTCSFAVCPIRESNLTFV